MATEFTFARTFVRNEKEIFSVSLINPDGTTKVVGRVIHWWIRHLEMMGWEAIGHDGHRGVHETRHQAAMALEWDGVGYPFPMRRA